MRTFDIVPYRVTAPGAVIAVVPPADGRFNIEQFDDSKNKAYFIGNFIRRNANNGYSRTTSIRGHDPMTGITLRHTTVMMCHLFIYPHEIYSGDIIQHEMSGSAVAGQIECDFLIYYYEDLPDVKTNYLTEDEFLVNKTNIETMGDMPITTTGAGIYTPGTPLSTAFPNLKGNKFYCLHDIFYGGAFINFCILKGRGCGNGMPFPSFAANTGYQVTFWLRRFSGIPTLLLFKGEDASQIYVTIPENQGGGTTFNLSICLTEMNDSVKELYR